MKAHKKEEKGLRICFEKYKSIKKLCSKVKGSRERERGREREKE